jgi:hypothetical protein
VTSDAEQRPRVLVDAEAWGEIWQAANDKSLEPVEAIGRVRDAIRTQRDASEFRDLFGPTDGQC